MPRAKARPQPNKVEENGTQPEPPQRMIVPYKFEGTIIGQVIEGDQVVGEVPITEARLMAHQFPRVLLEALAQAAAQNG